MLACVVAVLLRVREVSVLFSVAFVPIVYRHRHRSQQQSGEQLNFSSEQQQPEAVGGGGCSSTTSVTLLRFLLPRSCCSTYTNCISHGTCHGLRFSSFRILCSADSFSKPLNAAEVNTDVTTIMIALIHRGSLVALLPLATGKACYKRMATYRAQSRGISDTRLILPWLPRYYQAYESP